VVGDFNESCPGRHVLARRNGTSRSVAVDLSLGNHLFCYLATGGVWFDDPAADQNRGRRLRLACTRTSVQEHWWLRLVSGTNSRAIEDVRL